MNCKVSDSEDDGHKDHGINREGGNICWI